MASVIPVDNETKGSASRVTKSGRKITYEMTVVQQPERARACGQGAKSSTDRRPVDPPPIVDLRIFEGEDGARREITCAWNANFFLYASLEQARPMAQGRVPPNPSNAPVLTGTPVAGMSYLDRPAPAGYFIFPDLSVRHEGKYRLSFQLFEETRDESDKDPVEPTSPISGGTGETYIGRCQVKSAPFTVYSAKKFPGLAESTTLSRMVADQGCRVRIRRDVRMRRRDNKDSKEWDEYEDKTAGDHARRTASPESQTQPTVLTPEAPPDTVEGARAVHNTPYNMQPERRTSSHDMHPQYQQYQQPYSQQQPAPQNPQHGYGPQVQYDPAAMAQYQQPQYMHQPHVVQSPQQMSPYQQQYPPYGYPPQTVVPYGQNYYMGPQQPLQPSQQQPAPMYDHQMSHLRQEGSMNYGPPPPPPQQYQSQPMPPPQYNQPGQMQAPLGNLGHGYGRMSQDPSPAYTNPTPAITQTTRGKDLPPLKALETFPVKYDAPSPTVATNNERAPSYQSYQDVMVPPPPQYVTQSTGVAPKRAFGAVFNTQHIDQPLRAGARPSTAGGSPQELISAAGDDGSDEEILDMESLKMQYRRADGTQISRRWPIAL